MELPITKWFDVLRLTGELLDQMAPIVQCSRSICCCSLSHPEHSILEADFAFEASCILMGKGEWYQQTHWCALRVN